MTFEEMREKYGFEDSPEMRRRWKVFQEHRKTLKKESARLHKLFISDRRQWESEMRAKGKTALEIEEARKKEQRKTELLNKLHR